MSENPQVSVVLPVISATPNLANAVRSILAQDYRGPVELIVADGSDNEGVARVVREIAPDARVVPNPGRTTPEGLNAALGVAKGEIITRCDAHSTLPPGYLRRAVATLKRTGAANVGGRQMPVGTTHFTKALALALTMWLGTGGARYRQGGTEGPVDTVYLGTFRRGVLEAVGKFNAKCRVNEDYELNYRLRRRGEVIWFDPALEVGYRPRHKLRELARQYFHYGMGKATMLRIYPRSTRLRQILPPLLVLGLIASALFAAAGETGAALVVPGAWLAALFCGAAMAAGQHRTWTATLLPLVLATVHLSWGCGLWAGLAASPERLGSDLPRDRRAGTTCGGRDGVAGAAGGKDGAAGAAGGKDGVAGDGAGGCGRGGRE